VATGSILLIYLQEDTNGELRDRLALATTRTTGGGVLWVSAASPAEVSAALAEFVAAGTVRSAALVPADIPDDRLWVAHEWRGAFVVDRELVDLLGSTLDNWAEDANYADHEFLILRPRPGAEVHDPSSAEQVETAREYASAILDGRAVLAHTTVGAVLDARGEWFGDLADERVGGAFALLALSGATSDSTTIALRSPAALGLRIVDSDLSLPSHVRAGRLVVHGYGYSGNDAHGVAASVAEMSEEEAGRAVLDSLDERTGFGILLRIEAAVDPDIEIEDGSIFEQVSMNDVQTLGAAAPRRLTVRPGTFAPLPVPAWCLNRFLAPPAGEQVRPTPLALATPGRSQGQVWAERRSVLADTT
jgi:hypothetical protein